MLLLRPKLLALLPLRVLLVLQLRVQLGDLLQLSLQYPDLLVSLVRERAGGAAGSWVALHEARDRTVCDRDTSTLPIIQTVLQPDVAALRDSDLPEVLAAREGPAPEPPEQRGHVGCPEPAVLEGPG